MNFGLGSVVSQLEKLNKEIKKTDYERAREPLQNQIREIRRENFELKRRLMIMQDTLKEIVTSIEPEFEYVKIAIDVGTPKAHFYTKNTFNSVDYSYIKMVSIPLKSDLIEDISKIMQQIEMEK